MNVLYSSGWMRLLLLATAAAVHVLALGTMHTRRLDGERKHHWNGAFSAECGYLCVCECACVTGYLAAPEVVADFEPFPSLVIVGLRRALNL